MRISVNRACGLAVGVGLLAVPALAQKSTLKKALPAKTILYVSAPDIDRSIEEMMDMPLARMWREEEVQDFVGDLVKWVEAKVDEGLERGREMHSQGMFPFDPDDLLKLRVHGFTVAVTELDLNVGENGQPQPRIGVMAHINFGSSTAKWREIIGYGLKMLEQRAAGKMARSDAEVGGVKVTSLVPTMDGVGDMGLHLGWLEDGIVIGTLGGELRGALATMTAEEGVLTGATNYKATFGNLDRQGNELEAFFQPAPLIDFGMKVLRIAKEMEPDFPQQIDIDGIDRAIDALGLRSVLASGETMSYVSGRSVSKGYTYAPQPSRRGLFAGGNKQLDLGFLRWVPKDVASFDATTFDLAAMYDAFESALRAYDKDLAEQMMGQLGHYEEQFGVSLKEDLVGSVGNEFLMWSMPSAGLMSTPEMSILVEVKDEARLLKVLQTMAGMSDGMVEIEAAERRGITVHRVHVNIDPSGNIGMNPFDMFSPTFSFKDGYMVAAFSTGDIKRTFKRMDREDDDPKGDVRGNVEFAPYLSKLPEKGITSLGFVDWKANFESLYQMATSAAAFVPVNDEIPIDLSLLPDVSTLTQHLFGSVTWKTSDGNGYHVVSHSPWGAETYMIVGCLVVGVGAGVALMPR